MEQSEKEINAYKRGYQAGYRAGSRGHRNTQNPPEDFRTRVDLSDTYRMQGYEAAMDKNFHNPYPVGSRRFFKWNSGLHVAMGTAVAKRKAPRDHAPGAS